MRVLVVEDEQDLAMSIAEGLRREGYATDIAGTAHSALALAGVNSYDLVCLDLNLPDGDGLDVCRKVAAGPRHDLDPSGRSPKVIMITARGNVDDRIRGLDYGADDYMVKPFSLGELNARVRAVLRRDSDAGSSVITYAGIEMDTARQEVIFSGSPVVISVKEYALLRWFLLHPEEIHSAERLLEHVWDEHADPFTNTVRMTLSNLRRKLTSVGAGHLIVTLPGRGYALRASEAQ
jgi:DNA-binding response OmpR family regulator